MSLRTDVHSAFDVIAPATGGMAERVVETARREARPHKRRNAVMFRMRAPLSLVAVVVAAAIVVAVLVGGRLIHSATPAPMPAAPDNRVIFNAEVAQLEARPVVLPVAPKLADCPNSPGNAQGYDYGSGPVFANGSGPIATPWGNYWDITYVVDPTVSGPVLVRGRDLITGEAVIFSGKHAIGPPASTPGVPAGWHTEVVLDPSKADWLSGNNGAFAVRQSLSNSFLGCVGFQVDGLQFAETITTSAG